MIDVILTSGVRVRLGFDVLTHLTRLFSQLAVSDMIKMVISIRTDLYDYQI